LIDVNVEKNEENHCTIDNDKILTLTRCDFDKINEEKETYESWNV